jgi:hypothetical protein
MGFLSTTKASVVTFSPYTTRIFHLLNLILSETLKREERDHLPFGNLETTVNEDTDRSKHIGSTVLD